MKRKMIPCTSCGLPHRADSGADMCFSCYHTSRARGPKPKCSSCGDGITRHNQSGLCPSCKFPNKHDTHGKGVTVRKVLQRTEEMFQVSARDVLGPSKLSFLIPARFAAMAALKSHGFPVKEIGRRLGRDHSTVLHGLMRASEIAKRDPDYARRVAELAA